MDQPDLIRAQAQKIIDSGVLGKTRSYRGLLEYLVECTAEDRAPKELEIATEVFGRGPDFDPSQDSLVRVYAYNLRQKLDQYYANAGRDEPQRISIARGEYRVVLSATGEDAVEPAADPRRPWRWAGAAAAVTALLAAALVVGLRADRPAPGAYEQIATSGLWAGFFDDELPTLLVVGDYYIFGELDEDGQVERLIRDFSINSSRDLDDLFMYRPELMDVYLDLDLTYLPRAAAFAVKDLLRVLYTSDKPVRVVSMSKLNVADLKSHHVIYVGYISALDRLMEFAFASSGLAVGASFDELVDRETERRYVSGAGLAGADRRHYRDYGFLSTFPGPGGNQFMLVAGTRDAGVMHTAYALTNAAQVDSIEAALPPQPPGRMAFEMLYEVTGFDRMSLDARRVYSAPLDYRRIWGGELSQLTSR